MTPSAPQEEETTGFDGLVTPPPEPVSGFDGVVTPPPAEPQQDVDEVEGFGGFDNDETDDGAATAPVSDDTDHAPTELAVVADPEAVTVSSNEDAVEAADESNAEPTDAVEEETEAVEEEVEAVEEEAEAVEEEAEAVEEEVEAENATNQDTETVDEQVLSSLSSLVFGFRDCPSDESVFLFVASKTTRT